MNPFFQLLLGGFITAAVSAYGCTWLARWLAPRIGFVDQPDGKRKRHGNATPLLGGVAIFLAFSTTLFGFLALNASSWPSTNSLDLSLLVGSAALFCLLGLWDDKYPLRARYKFLFQILASLPFAIWGKQVAGVHLVGLHFDLGAWAVLFSVFWLVSCANVVNLVDGLDGLASSIGIIAVGTLAIMSLGGTVPVVSLMALIFAGSIAGFLIHNWPPAKIFLGDAGSLTIGFMIGAIAIESSNKTTAGFMLIFPLALLTIPIFDTTMAILRRKLTGRGIGEADRGHIHHRLLDRGLTRLQTLLVIIGICSAMSVACLLAARFNQDRIAVVSCVGVIALIVAGRVFGFHEMMLVFRHFEILQSTLGEALRNMALRRIVVHLEHAESISLDSLWETVLARVEYVGGLSLRMSCVRQADNQQVFTRHWSSIGQAEHRPGEWQLQYVIPRADGLDTTFVVSGQQAAGAKRQSLDQLTHIFEACCQQLPNAEAFQELDTALTIHPLPTAASFEAAAEVKRAA